MKLKYAGAAVLAFMARFGRCSRTGHRMVPAVVLGYTIRGRAHGLGISGVGNQCRRQQHCGQCGHARHGLPSSGARRGRRNGTIAGVFWWHGRAPGVQTLTQEQGLKYNFNSDNSWSGSPTGLPGSRRTGGLNWKSGGHENDTNFVGGSATVGFNPLVGRCGPRRLRHLRRPCGGRRNLPTGASTITAIPQRHPVFTVVGQTMAST